LGGNGLNMEIAVAIFLLFTLLVGVVIFRFDHPTKRGPKITGRGGDFNE
jgi:hypothetical protein